MAKVMMIQGTMSNAGKSFVVAGLCRVFRQDGYRVAPFKSQNMALNSFVTKDGLEMGRAQVMQAEAAGIEPSADMNPILLKPTSDVGSQVIVNGRVRGNMDARTYFDYRKELIPDIKAAFSRLSDRNDIIVVEGAGSPAEINLKENDIVNMGLADILDAPVLLVGDIDPGGVFAQLVGTVDLLEPEERARVRGFIINKFRGDPSLLTSGIDMLTERTGIPTLGVLPYIRISLDDEDSLSSRLENGENSTVGTGRNSDTGNCPADSGNAEGRPVDLAVVRLPHISNFTDFDVFDMIPDCRVRYVGTPSGLEGADLVILPGTKNTAGDLKWLQESGFGAAIKRYAGAGNPVWGICGGYQMLGLSVEDPDHVETEEGGTVDGLGLLPLKTVLRRTKVLSQVEGRFTERQEGDPAREDLFHGLAGLGIRGYEIHMGTTERVPVGENSSAGRSGAEGPLVRIHEEFPAADREDGWRSGNIGGSYVHGIFDADGVADTMVQTLRDRRRGAGMQEKMGEQRVVHCAAESAAPSAEQKETGGTGQYHAFRESQYDLLAEMIRSNLDMDAVYRCLAEAAL